MFGTHMKSLIVSVIKMKFNTYYDFRDGALDVTQR
jgi:hypothetical protein